MKIKASKKVYILSGVMAIFLLLLVVNSRWFLTLPFIPASWRNNFQLNANILPASDDSRSLFVAINPGFRAEFGDKENPTSAFLRFEKTATDVNSNADVSANLLDSLALVQISKDYQPGIEWQLFNVGIDATQLFGGTVLSEDSELLGLTQELLADQIADTTTDLETITTSQKVQTATTIERFQGYDVVSNLEVANDVDLKYTVEPGRGIAANIWIGDREYFDTACLKLLSLTGSDAGCNLPNNKFSFLLQLDNGQQLLHTPLSLDDSQNGTYYVVDQDGNYLLRLANPHLTDNAGQTSTALTMEVRPGQVGGTEIANYYIVTYTANLGWLIDSTREFPVKIDTGFFIDNKEFFPNTNTNSEQLSLPEVSVELAPETSSESSTAPEVATTNEPASESKLPQSPEASMSATQ